MSLSTATLIPGLLLFALGTLLLIGGSTTGTFLKTVPRSTAAAVVLFGGATVWFLYNVEHIAVADLIVFSTPTPLVVGFGAVAALSFKFAAEFLAVRGLAALILLGGWPLLKAAYMQYDKPQRLLMVTGVYLAVALALWLGAQPWRLRDFLSWLFTRPSRPTTIGGVLAGYGLLLVAVSFTY